MHRKLHKAEGQTICSCLMIQFYSIWHQLGTTIGYHWFPHLALDSTSPKDSQKLCRCKALPCSVISHQVYSHCKNKLLQQRSLFVMLRDQHPPKNSNPSTSSKCSTISTANPHKSSFLKPSHRYCTEIFANKLSRPHTKMGSDVCKRIKSLSQLEMAHRKCFFAATINQIDVCSVFNICGNKITSHSNTTKAATCTITLLWIQKH